MRTRPFTAFHQRNVRRDIQLHIVCDVKGAPWLWCPCAVCNVNNHTQQPCLYILYLILSLPNFKIVHGSPSPTVLSHPATLSCYLVPSPWTGVDT